jgi:hypothetical protein
LHIIFFTFLVFSFILHLIQNISTSLSTSLQYAVNKKSKIPFHNLDEKNDEVLTLRRPMLGWRRASLGTPGRGRMLDAGATPRRRDGRGVGQVFTAGGVGVGQVLHTGMGGRPVTLDVGVSGP